MDAPQAQSNELILWLKALDIPWWGKALLAVSMAAILGGGTAILVYGLYHADTDAISSAVALLVISLPLTLVVTALAFGDSGERGLQGRTLRVLSHLVPQAVALNLAQTGRSAAHGSDAACATQFHLSHTLRGCCADYCLHTQVNGNTVRRLFFSVELNVRKTNVVFWFPAPGERLTAVGADNPAFLGLIGSSRMHCVRGAMKEGYELNPSPVDRLVEGQPMVGLVFIRFLAKDFLLHAQETLYFAQDLAFFVRGMAMDGDSEHGF